MCAVLLERTLDKYVHKGCVQIVKVLVLTFTCCNSREINAIVDILSGNLRKRQVLLDSEIFMNKCSAFSSLFLSGL